jgi:hypothetical protein
VPVKIMMRSSCLSINQLNPSSDNFIEESSNGSSFPSRLRLFQVPRGSRATEKKSTNELVKFVPFN